MAASRKCPSCGKPAAPRGSNRAFPFCSDRCRLLDLGRWLSEEYRVPAGRPGDGAVTELAANPEDES
jgi:endogenous inhibitor of DNA gyrase (YacG/DUF329 family)